MQNNNYKLPLKLHPYCDLIFRTNKNIWRVKNLSDMCHGTFLCAHLPLNSEPGYTSTFLNISLSPKHKRQSVICWGLFTWSGSFCSGGDMLCFGRYLWVSWVHVDGIRMWWITSCIFYIISRWVFLSCWFAFVLGGQQMEKNWIYIECIRCL